MHRCDEDPLEPLYEPAFVAVDLPATTRRTQGLLACQNDGEISARAGRRAADESVHVFKHQRLRWLTNRNAGLQHTANVPPQHPFLPLMHSLLQAGLATLWSWQGKPATCMVLERGKVSLRILLLNSVSPITSRF
jgi:hypothetical protein